ncbi:Hypothetical predicted protein [Paramuricea clavata]|uniref:Uncharacterized protein n=1 Tax=Paramuricea clavata TaxID=317549 RepID=A0A6S7I7K3_PARCT|nr:Hypothetical predicted protein [Paramuricea clavata]
MAAKLPKSQRKRSCIQRWGTALNDEEIRNLHNVNKELLDYINCLENKQTFQNKGKDVANVAKKSRTLNTFMSHAKIALWFMKSFGLELKGIKAMEQQMGIFYNLYVDDNTSNSTDGSKGFDSLTDYDKEKIEQRRGQLNDISEVIPTPGEADGAQLSFTDLLKSQIQDVLTQGKYSCVHEPLIKIDLDHVVLDELLLLLRVTDVY